jgi:hypothetical protein
MSTATSSDGQTVVDFLKKKCDPAPQVLVLASPDGSVATSIAYALCDALIISRPETVYPFDAYDPDDKHDREPPCRHVYQTVKEARALVV